MKRTERSDTMKRVIIVIAAATLLVAASHAQETSVPQESIGELPAVVPPDFVPYDKEPVPIKTARPVYPEEAKRDSVEGTVYVKVIVDSMGTPVYAKIETSTTLDLKKMRALESLVHSQDRDTLHLEKMRALMSSAHSQDRKSFDRPALEAVMKFRFESAMLEERPVACWVVIPFAFKLKAACDR